MFSFFGADPGSGSEGTAKNNPQDLSDDAPSSSRPAGTTTASGAFGFDIWGVANAVSNTVKATAGDFVKSVQTTDWKAELTAFSKEVESDTQVLKAKTTEIVEHLPETVEHLPARVSEQAHHVASGLQHGLQAGGLPGAAGKQTLEEVSGSLSRFGQSLLVGTKELLEQVREAVEAEISSAAKEQKRAGRSGRASKAGGLSTAGKMSTLPAKYSRFDAEVSSMQRDSSTYCDEPEDQAEYAVWRAAFSLQNKQPEIEDIVASNTFMAELQSRIVPIIVEREDFWTRYFYRYHKLQQKEAARQQLAARAKSFSAAADEEDLGWGDDTEEDGDADADAAAHSSAEAGAVESKAAVTVNSEEGDDTAADMAAGGALELDGEVARLAAPLPGEVPTLAAVDEEPAPAANRLATSAVVPGPSPLPSTTDRTSTAPLDNAAQLPVPVAAHVTSPAPPPVRSVVAAARSAPRSPPLGALAGSSEAHTASRSVSHGGSSSSPLDALDVEHHDSVTAETLSEGSGKGEWCVIGGHGNGGSEGEGTAAAAGQRQASASPPQHIVHSVDTAAALTGTAAATPLLADSAATPQVRRSAGDAAPLVMSASPAAALPTSTVSSPVGLAKPFASPAVAAAPPDPALGLPGSGDEDEDEEQLAVDDDEGDACPARPDDARPKDARPARPLRADDDEEEDLDWGTWD